MPLPQKFSQELFSPLVGNFYCEVLTSWEKKSRKTQYGRSRRALEIVFGLSNRVLGKAPVSDVTVPSGLRKLNYPTKLKCRNISPKPGNVLRKDGDPEGAFKRLLK